MKTTEFVKLIGYPTRKRPSFWRLSILACIPGFIVVSFILVLQVVS
jgi:hypothetical protein